MREKHGATKSTNVVKSAREQATRSVPGSVANSILSRVPSVHTQGQVWTHSLYIYIYHLNETTSFGRLVEMSIPVLQPRQAFCYFSLNTISKRFQREV